MELRHIRYFMAVAEELNFTRAADKLSIAQPPLSRQIQDLEAELGARLFIRKPHALQLTEEGMQFRQYAMQILDMVNKSVEDIRDMGKGLQGTVYLASVEGHAPQLFSQWIAGFQKTYPHVQYNLWNGNSDEVIYRVMKGLCDLAIIMEPYNAEGVNALPVYKEPWIAMMGLPHPLAEKEGNTIEASDLLPYDLIIPSRESRFQEINAWFKDSAEKPKIRCRIAHMINAYELTRRGVGITVYPASLGNIAYDRSVCVKKIANPPSMASYVLIWNKNRQLSHAAEEFLQYIKGNLEYVETA